MVANPFSPFVELIHYLSNLATPEQILAYQISDDIQVRAEQLTEKNKSGRLTEIEKIELDQLIEFNSLLTYLKVKAELGVGVDE